MALIYLFSLVIFTLLFNKFLIKKNILLSETGDIHQKFSSTSKVPLSGGIFIFLGITSTIAQNQQEIIENMREEVSFLASDQLEGRQTGSKGEKIAAEYIKNKFRI